MFEGKRCSRRSLMRNMIEGKEKGVVWILYEVVMFVKGERKREWEYIEHKGSGGMNNII